MQLIHLKGLKIEKEIANTQTNIDQQTSENIKKKKIDDKLSETNISNQIKNQLKNTDQIKTKPIKNFLKENKKRLR